MEILTRPLKAFSRLALFILLPLVLVAAGVLLSVMAHGFTSIPRWALAAAAALWLLVLYVTVLSRHSPDFGRHLKLLAILALVNVVAIGYLPFMAVLAGDWDPGAFGQTPTPLTLEVIRENVADHDMDLDVLQAKYRLYRLAFQLSTVLVLLAAVGAAGVSAARFLNHRKTMRYRG